METLSWVWIVTISACLISFTHTVPLNCAFGTIESLGEVNEGYTGDIETITIVPDVELVLETICPQCAEFLELSFNTAITNATVKTKKPLDAEALRETGGLLSYLITCINGMTSGRTLSVRDVNEHAPVFDKEEYRANISQTLQVGQIVVQVKATDADLSPAYNLLNYSIQPPSATFEVNVFGEILLKEHLNSIDINQHNLTVKAQDGGGLFTETRVIIDIYEVMSLNFEYDRYEASIPENQAGPLLEVLPAPIKARTTSNQTVLYGITEVFPSDFWSNFTVDQSTGVLNLVTELDLEDLKDPIIIYIKASLEIVGTMIANATVTVHVKNVNEAPVFNVKLYTAEIVSAALTDQHVVQVEATDPDVGDTLQYTLVEPSSMFAVEPSSGQVYVVSVAGESGKVSLQVKAEDQSGLCDTTTVKVTIKESDSKDIVVISVNQELSTVQNKIAEMKEALERALGWSVTIISVSISEENPPRTLVSFRATEINGTDAIPKDTVQKKLVDNKENVLEEMQQVFGKDFQYDVVVDATNGIPLIPIILGTVIPLVLIVAGLSIYVRNRKSNLKTLPPEIGKNDSLERRPNLGGKDSLERRPNLGNKDSLERRPNLRDKDSIERRPNLGKRYSGRRPNLGDKDSLERRPNLGDKDCMELRLDLGRHQFKTRPKLYVEKADWHSMQ